MPRIVVNAFLTLDGVVQAPGGPDEDPEGGFLHGGWQAPYVDDDVSRSLERVTWNNSSLVKGDVVAELRQLQQQPGRTLQSWGSTDLLQTLLKNDLIDEYRLFIFPVVLGSGKRLFGSGTVPVALKQVESVTSGKGATYHRFERSGGTGGLARPRAACDE
ncbi:MAG TPA: dihydrofolate reductase family protein [Steroidobacteraceae bacterium]|nr:dihydrofolate reductase family protein [Steroidobacteraceae bacterium]